MPDDLVLELPNDIRSIEHAVDYVVQRCNSCEVRASKLRVNFRVALTEALSNAMLYGNDRDPRKRVRVEVNVGRDAITARVTDQGEGFDPHRVPDPTLEDNLSRPGGRGIFLMKKLLDEVNFNDRGNSVTLVLHIQSNDSLEGAARA